MASAHPRAARPHTNRAALERAAAFPALEAIFTRRSRRFALGAELTGPLAFRSDADPVPLSDAEEAILVAAGTGVTGVARDEWPFADAEGRGTGADKLTSLHGADVSQPARRRTAPSCSGRTTRASTCCRSATSRPTLCAAGHAGRARRAATRAPSSCTTAGSTSRGASPNLFGLNHWIANLEGSTLFMPISDVTRQCISALLLYFDEPHRYYLHDPHLGADPLRPLVRDGWFDAGHPVDLWDFERWQMVDMNGVEQGLVVQTLLLATQALGLGGHPFSGGKGRVTMGGEELWHAAGGPDRPAGSGFTFHRVPEDAPVGAGERIPVGLPGIFEGFVPPFHSDMEAAVDAVVALRWGPDGDLLGARAAHGAVAVAGDDRGRAPAGRRGDRGDQAALLATSGTRTAASRRRSTRS